MNLEKKGVARLERLIQFFRLFVHELAIRLHLHCQPVSRVGVLRLDFNVATDMSGNFNRPGTSAGSDHFVRFERLLFACGFIVLREADDAHGRCGRAFDLDLEGVATAPDLVRNTTGRLRVRITVVNGPLRQCDSHAEHGEAGTNSQSFHFRIPRKNKRSF